MADLIDRQFRQRPLHYVVQPLLAGGAVALILPLSGMLREPALAASFGASAFLAFVTPRAHSARPRGMIGGYVVGVLVGTLCHFVAEVNHVGAALGFDNAHILLAAVAVALTIFIEVVTNTEHPPSAGVALGFAISVEWSVWHVVVLLVGIVVLWGVKRLLRPWLLDLI